MKIILMSLILCFITPALAQLTVTTKISEIKKINISFGEDVIFEGPNVDKSFTELDNNNGSCKIKVLNDFRSPTLSIDNNINAGSNYNSTMVATQPADGLFKVHAHSSKYGTIKLVCEMSSLNIATLRDLQSLLPKHIKFGQAELKSESEIAIKDFQSKL